MVLPAGKGSLAEVLRKKTAGLFFAFLLLLGAISAHPSFSADFEDQAISLCRNALRSYLEKGESLPVPKGLPERFYRPGPLFVTIARNRQPRGCAGSFRATRASLAEGIITFSIAAATQDFRYPPLSSAELDEVSITITLPAELVPIGSLSEYLPWKEGLVIRKNGREGVTLPGEARTTAYAVKVALRNAGLDAVDGASLYKFTAKKISE